MQQTCIRIQNDLTLFSLKLFLRLRLTSSTIDQFSALLLGFENHLIVCISDNCMNSFECAILAPCISFYSCNFLVATKTIKNKESFLDVCHEFSLPV